MAVFETSLCVTRPAQLCFQGLKGFGCQYSYWSSSRHAVA